jgi:hypothetical protein
MKKIPHNIKLTCCENICCPTLLGCMFTTGFLWFAMRGAGPRGKKVCKIKK